MHAELRRLLESQYGVASTAQALSLGESYETIRRRSRDNDWQRALPRVVRPVGASLTFEGRLAATRLTVAGGMAFGGMTAAALWGVPGASRTERPHVVVPDNRRLRSSSEMHVQRQSRLLEHIYVRDDWPVVSIEAAVVGAAEMFGFAALVDVLQELLRDGRTTSVRVLSMTGRGVKGSALVSRAMAVAGDGFGSTWERRLARALRSRGRSGPRAQFRVVSPSGLIAYVDLAFPQVNLAIEIDGYVAHSRPAEFRYDRVRQNALVSELGWTVLRFTPFEISTAPARVVRQIWSCFDRLAAQGC
jgi:very-short-patch-repair endonuclease